MNLVFLKLVCVSDVHSFILFSYISDYMSIFFALYNLCLKIYHNNNYIVTLLLKKVEIIFQLSQLLKYLLRRLTSFPAAEADRIDRTALDT